MFKRVIYDTEIFNLEFNLSHSSIPKILVIAQWFRERLPISVHTAEISHG